MPTDAIKAVEPTLQKLFLCGLRGQAFKIILALVP